MTKQMVLVKVDVPDGWEVVGYGVPRPGEYYLGHRGSGVYQAKAEYTYIASFIIEQGWVAPKWLKSGTWIAMDKSGSWWVFGVKPERASSAFFVPAGTGRSLLNCRMMNWTPPPCTDWTQSLRQIP